MKPKYKIDTRCTPDNLPPPEWVLRRLSVFKNASDPHWSHVVADENIAFFWNAMTTGFTEYPLGVMASIETMQAGINILPADWFDRKLLQYKMYCHLAEREKRIGRGA